MAGSAASSGDATVHISLRGRIDESAMTCLRQQFAACLRSGVKVIRVHADEQDDVDLVVLQALQGVHTYLTRHGGTIGLLGAQPRVLSKLAVHSLGHLVATEPEPLRHVDVPALMPPRPARRFGRAAGGTPSRTTAR